MPAFIASLRRLAPTGTWISFFSFVNFIVGMATVAGGVRKRAAARNNEPNRANITANCRAAQQPDILVQDCRLVPDGRRGVCVEPVRVVTRITSEIAQIIHSAPSMASYRPR